MIASDEIYASFRAWVSENTPPGARLEMRDGIHTIEVCCDGRISWTAYHCCYDPGHEGDCYSSGKRVNFEPEQGGPNLAQSNNQREP